jgi:hypothetical protein
MANVVALTEVAIDGDIVQARFREIHQQGNKSPQSMGDASFIALQHRSPPPFPGFLQDIALGRFALP